MHSTKICRTCGVGKPVAEFYFKRITTGGITQYRPDCRVCAAAAIAADPIERERIRQKTAEWRASDPVRGRKSSRDSRNRHINERRETQRADRTDPVKRPRILASAKRSVIKHKEKRLAETKAHREANSAHYKAYLQGYWKEHPERAAEYQGRRRARKAAADGSHSAADIRALRAKQDNRCANPMCMADISKSCSIDHIVALVNGGSNWPDNLQALCKPCNSKKRSRDNALFLEIYAQERGLPWPPPGLSSELSE